MGSTKISKEKYDEVKKAINEGNSTSIASSLTFVSESTVRRIRNTDSYEDYKEKSRTEWHKPEEVRESIRDLVDDIQHETESFNCHDLIVEEQLARLNQNLEELTSTIRQLVLIHENEVLKLVEQNKILRDNSNTKKGWFR